MKKRGRKPVLVTIDLPMPPASDDRRNTWIESAIATLRNVDLRTVPGVVSVKVMAALPDKPRDIAEISRAIVAVLVAENIIADDASITDLSAKWDRTIPAGTVHVVCKRTIPPAQRSTEETRRRVARKNQQRLSIVMESFST